MWILVAGRKEWQRNVAAPLDGLLLKAQLAIMANELPTRAPQLRGYVQAMAMVGASTVAGLLVAPRWGTSAVDLLYLPAVLGAAVMAGFGPALFAAVGSALLYNYLFTQPRLTLRIDRPSDVLTVVVLFLVAVVTSRLAASIRTQARLAQAHAARNATIAGFARRLLSCASEPEIADVSVNRIAEIFDCNAMLVEGAPGGRIIAGAPVAMQLTPSDVAAVALALGTGHSAGRGLDRAVPTEWQFHPIASERAMLGAMAIARDDGAPPVGDDRRPLLESLLDQVALALERSRLEAETAQFARVREQDRMRSVLLSTIGEDLRPLLESLGVAVRRLRRSGLADKSMVAAIGNESARLDRFLANLNLGPAADQKPIIAGDVAIDLFQRSVSRGGRAVRLTPKEYDVLAELAKHAGRVLSHGHLLKAVWGPAQATQTEYLRVAVRGLRQKLERDSAQPELIINEPAVGYRLRIDPAA